MSAGIPFGFGAVPIPGADPNDLRQLFQRMPFDPSQRPGGLDPSGPAGVLVHQPGARVEIATPSAPAVAMNEADTQRLERQTGMMPGGGGQSAGLASRLLDPSLLGQPQTFAGTAGATLPGDRVEVPLPPRRPPGLGFGAAPDGPADDTDAGAEFDRRFNGAPVGQGASTPASDPLRAGLIRQRPPGSVIAAAPPTPDEVAAAAPAATAAIAPTPPKADRPAPGMVPAQVPFGVPQGLATPPAAPAPGAATAGAGKSTEEPSFWSRIGTGLQRMGENGLGDQLMALGAGLLSAKGTQGWSNGIKGMLAVSQEQGRTSIARQEFGLRMLDAAQKQTGLKGNRALVKAAFPGLTDEQLQADNSQLVTAAIQKLQNPNAGREMRADSSGVQRWVDSGQPVFSGDEGKTKWVQAHTPDGGTLLYDESDPSKNQFLVPGQPVRPATADELAAYGIGRGQAAKMTAKGPELLGSPQRPEVKTFELRDGTKVERQWDPTTNTWGEPSYGANPPAAQAPSNPYATGKFNEGQGKAAGFADRMMGSEPILRELEGVNTTPILSSIADSASFPNSFKTAERQRLEQARRDFVNAQLRRESGAAISKSEFTNAERQYFPQPGDGPDVIAQKRANRQRAIEAMGRESGPAYAPAKRFNDTGDIVPSMAPADRFKQLRAGGLSRQDAYARMHDEGY